MGILLPTNGTLPPPTVEGDSELRSLIGTMAGVLPDHLSDDDLQYFQAVAEQLEAAQAVMEHWRTYVTRKYQLGPYDDISSDDGVIRREG